MLRNTEQAWGTVAKLLHWSMLLLILVQVALGWSAVNWALSPTKINLFVWHKAEIAALAPVSGPPRMSSAPMSGNASR
ncbi:MAG: hypothetical protein E2O52_10080 [Gammaproteobacteria bacterium]|nr:MAG: hypothetical protein E2O52_10080 [Gammaproteobacteria bacterium]